MEQDWLQKSKLLDSEPQKGRTLDFRAPLAISEEAVELYFGDIINSPNSHVQCQKQGCILSVTFSDNEAFQRAVSVSSYTIESGCVLTPLSAGITALPPIASAANPTSSDSVSPIEPHSANTDFAEEGRHGTIDELLKRGVDCTTGISTVVLSLNVDCQEHITKYCLEDLNRYLNVSWCIIRSAEVPGLLLLEYSTSTSQLDVGNIVSKIYEYTQQFTTIVVAVPEHHDDRSLQNLVQPCNSLVSYCLIGCLSEKKLYKICCKKTCAPKLQQCLSGITTVPLTSCTSIADRCGNADPKCREEDSHRDAACAVKCEQSASDAVTKSTAALAPSNVLAPSVSELNRDATPSVTASGTNATSATTITTTQIASHTGVVVTNSVPSIGAPGSSTSVGLSVAVHQVQQQILVDASSASAPASAAVLAAPHDYQPEDVLSELEASAGSKIQKTPTPVESAKYSTFRSDRVDFAAGDMSLTVPADDRTVQRFKNDLEWRFRKDLEKMFPVTEPTCSVKYLCSDTGFHFFGSRDSVLKAEALLFALFESVSVERQGEMSRIDDYTSSRWMNRADGDMLHHKSKVNDVLSVNERQGEMSRIDDYTSSRWMNRADGDMLHHKSKVNDVPTTERAAADRRRYGFEATPGSDSNRRQTPNELYEPNELPGKIGKEAPLRSAATSQRDAFDKYSQQDKLTVSTEGGFTTERAFTSERLLLQLEKGSVAEQEADILVNSVDCALTLSSGRISRSILEKGGQELQLELNKKYPKGLNEFQFAVTRGHGLLCTNVLHVVCGRYTGRESELKFKSLILECLKYANDNGMKSIVFPAIGAGVLLYPPAVVVELLHSAVSMFSDAYPVRRLESVKCVVYDKPTYDSFKFALDTLRAVGAGSRYLTPGSFETPAYDSTNRSYSQVASTRTASLPRTHISGSFRSTSDSSYRGKK